MLHHVVVTNKPDNTVFQLMTNVRNLCDIFPGAQIGHGKGFGYKIILLRIFLDTISDDEHVLFTDAHDVRITASHEEIMARYWEFGSDIVFSAERNCWPNKSQESKYMTNNFSEIRYKYLNSGGFIGRVSALKDLIDENFHNASGSTDDQTFYTTLYLNSQTNRRRIQLDTRATIFQCLHLAVQDIDQETLKNTVTGTTPMVWHSNGYLHQFFMEKLCGLEYVQQVKLEIDQQLISPQKNVIAITTATSTTHFEKYFYKTIVVKDIREAQLALHKEYPNHWFLIIEPTTVLPDQFDYCIYGRVMDTRKLYSMFRIVNEQVDQMPFMGYFQLYYDKTKVYDDSGEYGFYDKFARGGMIEILCQQMASHQRE